MPTIQYDRTIRDTMKSDATGIPVGKGEIAHLYWTAAEAVATSTTGIHAARTCPSVNVAATGVVKASTATTDKLTITETVALGAAANALNILLTTAADDNLAVSKTDGTSTINIALAKTTAAKNTASLIQTAVRALSTVGGIAVTAVTCTAGGNWDTAAIATGETGSVAFSGGITATNDVLTTGITNPVAVRNITATAGGTAGDIKAVQVIIAGTNDNNEAITETLPVFTVDTAGTVVGSKAFKTVTSITIPPHDGTGATTAIGWGDKLGLPYLLTHNTLLYKQTFLNDVVESTEPTVTTSATAIESNTVDLNSALNGTAVDAYFIV
jgi:hypothetical protein